MNRIPFHDRAQMIEQAVRAVCDEHLPESVLFVIPDGFGEEDLARDLVEALISQQVHPSVARINAEFGSLGEYLERLFSGWKAPDVAPPPKKRNVSPAEFEGWVSRLPRHRPFVQIIGRFHRLLDNLDQSILGSLRTLEQDRSIRSIVLAPYEYRDLKRFWAQHAEKLTISNYGDKHRVLPVRPLDRDALLELGHAERVAQHILEFAVEQSGGIPDLFDLIVRRAEDAGRDAMIPRRRDEIVAEAVHVAQRLVEHLDPDGQCNVRRAVANVFLGMASIDDLVQVREHAWKLTLLDGSRLRSQVVGRAALEWLAKDEPTEQRFMHARAAYGRQRWREAEQLLDLIATPAAKLLRLHARAMMSLYGEEDAEIWLDTSWSALIVNLKEAAETAEHLGLRDDVLQSRYDELTSFATSVHRALTQSNRPLDALAGLDARLERSPVNALLLLVSQLRGVPSPESGEPIPMTAVQRVMPLPEQILRILASWRLDVRYESVPEATEEVVEAWKDVAPYWNGRSPLPPLPAPGEDFRSLPAFALFVATLMRRRGIRTRAWEGPDELNKQLELLEVRRDQAHALAFVAEKRRSQYLKLVWRWTEALLECSGVVPDGMVLADLRARLDPLPGVSQTGELEWSS